MKNWLVVANAARARVLEDSDTPGTYVHVADLVHPQSRQKGSELADDRPGHAVAQPHGTGSTAYGPRSDPREREHERFARELAALLDAGVAARRCAGLVLVASNPFLGHLKSCLGPHSHRLLLRTIAADYTTLDDGELAQQIAAHAD